MSCYGNNCYLPNPPKEWYRVQDRCSINPIVYDPSSFVIEPLTGGIVQAASLAYTTALLNKGNILQYKKNSSNITKAQKYSQIAKGKWTNRTTTWATQSQSYTNPNTNLLKRVNGINYSTGIPIQQPTTGGYYLPTGETTSNVTCPSVINPSPVILPIPNPIINTNDTPVIPPPPVNPGPGTSVIPVVPDEIGPEPIVIQNYGNLICNVQENLCTGETVFTPSGSGFNPTTNSDVPGPIEYLYWKESIQTWYPKPRYFMNSTTDKWPINSKGIESAIRPDTPVIVNITSNSDIVTLTWTQTTTCLTTNSFNIYQNDILIQTVDATVRTVDITVLTTNTYTYYIKAINGNVESYVSNIVSIYVTL